MGNFTANKNCPICNGKGKRCAIMGSTLSESVIYHCREDLELPNYRNLGLSSIGFYMYKPTDVAQNEGATIDYVPVISQEERQKTRDAKEKEAALYEYYAQNRILQQLTPAQRHIEYTKMLDSLNLSSTHKGHLNGIRGFLHEQIEINGYRTVGKFEKVSGDISDKTPGVFVNYLGETVINYGGAGILIPVRDLDGNIVAFQIRNTETQKEKNKSGEDFGKYLWSGHPQTLKTDAERKRLFYPSIHLPENGEKPLHVANPHNLKDVETLYLAEGVLKPDITAYRFEQVVIGSPGGSWYSSPEQLFATIKYFNTKNFVLYADAGAIVNPNIIRMYNRARQLLENEGIDFKVAWWGQITKTKNAFLESGAAFSDIDELDGFRAGFGNDKPEFEKIQYLTWDQWMDLAYSPEIAAKRTQKNFVGELEARESLRELIDGANNTKAATKWWEKYKDLTTINPTVKNERTFTPPEKTELPKFDQSIIDDFGFGPEFEEGERKFSFKQETETHSAEQEQAKTENKSASANNVLNFDISDKKKFKTWKKRIEYTPTHEFNTPYVSIDHKIDANNIYFINSGLGTGKTWWALEMLKQMGAPFLYVTFRNSLCEQFIEQCQKRGIDCSHGNDSGFKYQNDTQIFQGMAFCIDSLHKVSLPNLDGKIIIVDESFSTIQEMLTKKNLEKGRVKLLEFFKESMKKCASAIFMDGHLTDSLVDYVHKLAPEKRIIKYKNKFQGRRFNITFVNGSYDDITSDYYSEKEINEGISENGEKIKIKVRDRSPVLNAINNSIGNICIATDSLNQSMSLNQRLKDQGRFGLVVNSISYRENWLLCAADPESSVQNFIKDVDGFIEKYKLEYLIYTPTAEAGIDISIHKRIPNYFTHQYCLFFNVIGTFGQSQMIARLRDPECPRTVWLYPHPMGADYEYTGCGTSEYRNIFLVRQRAYLSQLRKDAEYQDTPFNESEMLVEASKKVLETSEREEIHSVLCSDLILKIKYEKSEPRKCLLNVLKGSGHKVSEVALLESKKALELNKEASDNFKKEESENIAQAEVLESKQYDLESAKINVSSATRYNLEKTAINFIVPGITEKPIWDADFVFHVKYGERSFLRDQNRFYLFKNKDDLTKWELNRHKNNVSYAIFSDKYETATFDVNNQYTQLRLLQDQSNIDWFLDPENTWYIKNEWFDDFDGIKFINKSHDPVAQKVFDFLSFFNKNIEIFGKQYPIKKTPKVKNPASAATKQITKIIEWLGLKVKSKKSSGYKYSIDPQSFNPYHKACQDCLKVKYSDQKVQSIPETIIEKGTTVFNLEVEKQQQPTKSYRYTYPYEAFKALEETWHNPHSIYAVLAQTVPAVISDLSTAPNSFYSIKTANYIKEIVAWGNVNVATHPSERIILSERYKVPIA
jgi:hypothetical protein